MTSRASNAAENSASAPKIARVEIGLKNHFKVGFWTPVRIEAEGIDVLEKPRMEVTVADSDGVPTTANAPLSTASAGHTQAAVINTKMGRIGSPIHVSFFDGDRRLDEQTLRPDAKSKSGASPVALPATAELIVTFGPAPAGFDEAFPNREPDAGQLARQHIALDEVDQLPTDWFGYEAIDVLMISTVDGKLCRELAADAQRLEALTRWIELGGRLVMICGDQSAEPLFAPGGPLGRFAPGKLAEMVSLRETGALEHFAGTTAPIPIDPAAVLRVPRFTDVEGNIEAYSGRRASELPIVVRSPRGLGEVAFVGVDLSEPPLKDWSGRVPFLQALLNPYLPTISFTDSPQRLVTRGYSDLSGAMRQQLGQSFATVVPIGFAIVAGLAILFILFIGPLDYLLVNRWLRRPWVAWVTFPLILVNFCGAAMRLASWHNGRGGPVVNRMELVDVDTFSGRARGALWTTLYSPTASQFDLKVERAASSGTTAESDELLSWWGLPGTGIGGMHAGGLDPGLVRSGYRYGTTRNSLEDLPVLASATKSLMARWTAPVTTTVEAELSDRDGLATGTVTNRTGFALHNARLLYATWAYRLGDLDDGQRIEVGEQLSPRRVRTIVTHDALSETGVSHSGSDARAFNSDEASAKEILNLMMFYEAAGGFRFANLPNRYQAFCDLSRSLELGRAILVADADTPGTRLVDDATKQAIGGEADESEVIYRFVLRVNRRAAP